MNASTKKWRMQADRRERPRAVIFALLMLGGGLLGGCADFHRATYLPPVNPESPVAGVVGAAAKENFKRPSLASVPPKPLNIPPPSAVKAEVIDMVRCRRAYQTWAAENPALVSQTTGFAEGLRAELDNRPEDRPTPAQAAVAEAEAAKLRAFAEPPPPMHPGPPPSPSEAAPPGTASAPQPRPSRVAAAAHAAPTSVSAPASVPPSSAPGSVAAPAAQQPFAVAQTSVDQASLAPAYRDPLLAHCQ